MKERPLLFSAPMVRAILAGAKTQTRRVVKAPGWDPASPEYGGLTGIKQHADKRIGLQAYFWHARSALSHGVRCPYGQPGDRLWVKEQTLKVEDHGWIGPVYTESDAGRDALAWGYGEADDPDHIPPHAIKRRPSIFMTRAMSRIELEVTGVRVERLKDISTRDCWAEGIAASPDVDPVHEYRELWELINGRGSWESNSWVWIVEFRRVQPT